MDAIPGYGWFNGTVAVVLWIIDFFVRLIALILVPRNRRPQTATAWLLAIFLLPSFIGILLFMLFGSRRLPKKRRQRQLEINNYIQERTQGIEFVIQDRSWPSWLEPIVDLNRTLGALPLVGDNQAELYPDYEESIAAMTAEVASATTYVHVEFYILSYDQSTRVFFDALQAAVERGVTVRVLLDHVASIRYPGYRRTIRQLKAIGVDYQLMLPIQPLRGKFQRPDLRNHRKLLVIDGLVAYTGSQNMVDSSYNKPANIRRGLHWKDLMVRFEGPIVDAIDALFITDWYCETDELLTETDDLLPRADELPAPKRPDALDAQVVPSGPGFEGENNLRLFNSLLYAAQEKIIIVSPYFVPDESMLYSITTAAQKGLQVDLFVSEIGDQFVTFHAQRSYYEALLEAGVRIFMYKAPTVLHAKFFTLDEEVCVIGSSNMDMRSFSLNLEISVMVRGASFVTKLRKVEASYRAMSRELTLDEWMNRPWFTKVLDNVARLTAAVQ